MIMPRIEPPIFVVVAKRPDPGAVKTRLAAAADIGPAVAAAIAEAMLCCTVERLRAVGEVVLAVSPDGCGAELADRLGVPALGFVDQGGGHLGERLARVWQTVGGERPIAFLGMDAPDVPEAALRAIGRALGRADVAIGRTSDGGYWTLAARRWSPHLLHRIDWGTASVYDQTCIRAGEAGLRRLDLPAWEDVDDPDALRALCRRLSRRGRSDRPDPLGRLAGRLAALGLDPLSGTGLGAARCPR